MVSVEDINSDPRFKIDTQVPGRLFVQPVRKYEVIRIPLKKLFIYYGESCTKIPDTVIYKFLDGEPDVKMRYEEFCMKYFSVFRNLASYNSLKNNFENVDYDIKKGAVVVNQLNIIIDGQHRCSLLYKKFGPNHKIEVVRLYYATPLIGLRLHKFMDRILFLPMKKWANRFTHLLNNPKLIKLAHKYKFTERILIFFYNRIQGGEFKSRGLRTLYEQEYSIKAGLYSYGCFNHLINFGGKGISVGSYCSIASNVRFLGGNHPYQNFSTSPVFYNRAVSDTVLHDIDRFSLEIGNDVWIGINVLITCGCRKIGNGAVIGAGAVVTKDVPPYAIVAGNPAKIIKFRFSDEEIAKLEKSRWWLHSPYVIHSICKKTNSIIDFCKAFDDFA